MPIGAADTVATTEPKSSPSAELSEPSVTAPVVPMTAKVWSKIIFQLEASS